MIERDGMDGFEGLDPEVGDTAVREVAASVERVETAERGVVRTIGAVDLLRSSVRVAKDFHMENGYVPKLRAIFRGDAA